MSLHNNLLHLNCHEEEILEEQGTDRECLLLASRFRTTYIENAREIRELYFHKQRAKNIFRRSRATPMQLFKGEQDW